MRQGHGAWSGDVGEAASLDWQRCLLGVNLALSVFNRMRRWLPLWSWKAERTCERVGATSEIWYFRGTVEKIGRDWLHELARPPRGTRRPQRWGNEASAVSRLREPGRTSEGNLAHILIQLC